MSSRTVGKRSIERVCTCVPYCWCTKRDRFSCACVPTRDTDGEINCVTCGSKLVTVKAFEKLIMQQNTGQRRKTP